MYFFSLFAFHKRKKPFVCQLHYFEKVKKYREKRMNRKIDRQERREFFLFCIKVVIKFLDKKKKIVEHTLGWLH